MASLEDRSLFTQDNDRWSRCCYRERRGRGRVRGQGCRPPRVLTCLDSEATGARWGWGQTAASCRKVEEPGQLGADALRKHRRFETPRRGFREQRPHPRHRLPAPRSFWPWRARGRRVAPHPQDVVPTPPTGKHCCGAAAASCTWPFCHSARSHPPPPPRAQRLSSRPRRRTRAAAGLRAGPRLARPPAPRFRACPVLREMTSAASPQTRVAGEGRVPMPAPAPTGSQILCSVDVQVQPCKASFGEPSPGTERAAMCRTGD